MLVRASSDNSKTGVRPAQDVRSNQPAEMHHRHRARVEEGRREIAIGRGIEAVVDHPREAEIARERVDVHAVGGSGNGAGAEGQRVGFLARAIEARVIAPERGGV